MPKKISVVILASLISGSVLLAAGCGGDDKKSTDNSAASSVSGETSKTENPFEDSEPSDSVVSDAESKPTESEVSEEEASKAEESEYESQIVSDVESEPEDSENDEDSEFEDVSDDEDISDDEDVSEDEESEFEDFESLPDGEVVQEYVGTWRSSYDFSGLEESEAAIIKKYINDLSIVMVLSDDGSASAVISSYDEPDETGKGSWNANGNQINVEIEGSVKTFVFNDGKLTSDSLPYIVLTRS